MAYLRRFIQYLAFTVGLITFANLILDVGTAMARGYGAYFALLFPVIVGGLLALITARAAVSREWQKAPALVIAAAYFAAHARADHDLTASMPDADTWLQLAPWLLAKLAWGFVSFAITFVIYRSSDRTLREIGRTVSHRFRRPRAPLP